jgi:hypothetical protein
VDVSPDLISRVTDAVMDEDAEPLVPTEWQQRRLDKSYVIVYLDALRVKSKQEGKSCEKSVRKVLRTLRMWLLGSTLRRKRRCVNCANCVGEVYDGPVDSGERGRHRKRSLRVLGGRAQ